MIGDGNNMANSWINAAYVFGLISRCVSRGLQPDHLLARALKKAWCVSCGDAMEAAEALIANTDVWRDGQKTSRRSAPVPRQLYGEREADSGHRRRRSSCTASRHRKEVTAM